MKRKFCYYGNPILRKKAVKVTAITDEIRELVHDMIEMMDDRNGVGLAASQVGELWQIFVIRPEIQSDSNEFLLGEPIVYINPELSNPSEETQTGPEGCLSIPGIHMEVTRPKSIHIKAMDLDGNIFEEDVTGFKAREVMHENDHLNGVLYIDRLNPEQKKEIQPVLKEIKEKYSS